MARYIDADVLKKEGWVLQRYVCEDGCAFIERREIDQMPTIEARPVVRGEWMHDSATGIAFCSVCNMDAVEDGTNFCPNCGADMRGEEDDARSESR